MSRFSRIQVFSKMEETGLVPLFFHEDADVVKQVVKACYLGGARLFEFTSRGDFAHEIFADLAKFCVKECPELILGVGSVTDAAAASLYMQMGANFIVTPVLREDIAIVCNRRKVFWSPGCGSLTEIARAEELGCEVVKLFPGDVYGAEFVKGIKGPCPWTNIMPTGGVTPTEENLKYWFDAGVSCVGMGSQLVTKNIVSNGDYGALERKVRETLDTIQRIKDN
ncbi:bifunctional 4-hydroxy-2-oxoglutarate aldolase/2-dehydro-3-deoxy-phosphogluconate aldolase [Fulvivirga kasyanovii]|uniref:Bifunctional 4-hydroxy-2-oxoglutarate aldolase/2-dehydro-3-deoxy-phosphogluconate aldolase n=1 Tax=Fulvivirga kasyanovii TaxID=396812 RepID=A0ABW9RMB9_9BACT|nr:bifunctional 4-hydroxy-2-oxoglutarate aldolase/2-dehydro-3-deoxy-phosphogluconate aldolase [Fulvivirga kasyanovii]MTI24836.1 bifunctional 4-hydroxy-2-oxoglutarate aldolase/2-dehydro-3-deoxy-phosphogluconate aldolase [Fulvivirga kasyanovii]